MTLKEYLNQKEPVRNPNVILRRNEYTKASMIKMANGEIRTKVYIKTKNPLLAGIEYCLIGTRFYTVDGDGNPISASCFRIENNQ